MSVTDDRGMVVDLQPFLRRASQGVARMNIPGTFTSGVLATFGVQKAAEVSDRLGIERGLEGLR